MFNYTREFYALSTRKHMYVLYKLVFAYLFIALFIYADYFTCKESFEKRSLNIAAFKNELFLECSSHLVSSKNGWKLDVEFDLFIKDDLFYKTEDCAGVR